MNATRSSRPGQELVVAEPAQGEIVAWLDELAEIIEREHAAVTAAVGAALRHAIVAGDNLLDAQAQLDEASFERWVEARGLHYRTAQKYMRLATYQDELMALPDFYDLTMTRANLYLRGLPRRIGPDAEAREQLIEEIKRLHELKTPVREIARSLGVSRDTIRYHTDVKYRNEQKRRRVEQIKRSRDIERGQETIRRLRSRGGTLQDAYYALSKTYGLLKKASTETHNPEEQRDLERSLSALNEAEGWIERAVRSDLPANQRPRVQRIKHR